MKFLKIARLAFLLPVLMVASACSDLMLEPHASLSEDVYFETLSDFEAAVVGTYNQMQGSAWYGRSIHLMSDIMGNDVKQTGSANRYQEFADFEGQVVTGHGYEGSLWTSIYDGVNQLNKMIKFITCNIESHLNPKNMKMTTKHSLLKLTVFRNGSWNSTGNPTDH